MQRSTVNVKLKIEIQQWPEAILRSNELVAHRFIAAADISKIKHLVVYYIRSYAERCQFTYSIIEKLL